MHLKHASHPCQRLDKVKKLAEEAGDSAELEGAEGFDYPVEKLRNKKVIPRRTIPSLAPTDPIRPTLLPLWMPSVPLHHPFWFQSVLLAPPTLDPPHIAPSHPHHIPLIIFQAMTLATHFTLTSTLSPHSSHPHHVQATHVHDPYTLSICRPLISIHSLYTLTIYRPHISILCWERRMSLKQCQVSLKPGAALSSLPDSPPTTPLLVSARE